MRVKKSNSSCFTKRFKLSPSSVYEMSESRTRRRKISTRNTQTKSARATYKAKKGVLQHMKTAHM